MNNRNPVVPQDLAAEYDDYVDDALDLAAGRLSPEREAAVRARMVADPVYRGVVQPVLEAHEHPEAVREEELQQQWQEFTHRAGLSTVEADLAEFQKRVQSRERAGSRRMMLFAAVLSSLVIVPVGGLTYMFATSFENVETAANVTSEVWLPDGSVATLAPSSEIEYRTGMVTPLGDLDREVTLRGSADFVVTQRAPMRFTVITAQAHVVVMGTRFRVEHHAAFTLVRVLEGTVNVRPLNGDGDFVGQPVTLQAGGGARIFSGGAVALEGNGSTNPGKQP